MLSVRREPSEVGTGRVGSILVVVVNAPIFIFECEPGCFETRGVNRFNIGNKVCDILFKLSRLGTGLETYNIVALSSGSHGVVLDLGLCRRLLDRNSHRTVSSKSACFGNVRHVQVGGPSRLNDRGFLDLLSVHQTTIHQRLDRGETVVPLEA